MEPAYLDRAGFQKGLRLPPTPQTLQQAQDPEAERALASAPPWLKDRPLRALPGAGEPRDSCAPERNALADPEEAHARMCACLEGGGKFSLQV